MKNTLLVLLAYFVGIISLYLPNEIHTADSIKGILDGVTAYVPSIRGYKEKSDFPEAANFFFVFSALFYLPILYVGLTDYNFLIKKSLGYEGQFKKVRDKTFPKLFCLFALCFLFLLIFIFWFQPGYEVGLPINSSKLALALGGPLFGFFGQSYICLSFIVVYIKIYRRLISRIQSYRPYE